MRVKRELRGSRLFLYLSGELDHHAAHHTLTEISAALDEHMPMHCNLDLSGLTFMDSSGIAVVLGTYRRLKSYGAELAVYRTPGHAARILTMAGVDRIVHIGTADEQSEVYI
jgi:stage II sporulation protein AA (anti-sigma F factor antagonist)